MAQIQHEATMGSETDWVKVKSSASIDQEFVERIRKLAEFLPKELAPGIPDIPQFPLDKLSATTEDTVQEQFRRKRDHLFEWSKFDFEIFDLHLDFVRQTFDRLFLLQDSLDQATAVERLEWLGDGQSVMMVALNEFRKKGNAERLLLAGAVLERYGRDAFEPLENLLHDGTPEGEYFVDTLINITADLDFPDIYKDLILKWSQHPIAAVRMRILESADSLPTDLQTAIMKNLSSDPDEEISEYAQSLTDERG